MEWLFKFLDNHGVLEGLGIAFILLVILAFVLWKIGVLKVENPARQIQAFVEGVCPDPGCKSEICTKLDHLVEKADKDSNRISRIEGKLDILIARLRKDSI